MTHSNINFSGGSRSRLSELSAQNGDTFENCNFAQFVTGIDLFGSLSGLTFRGCNLTNVTVPGDSVIEDCLTITISFCSHLHPTKSDISECDEECSHVVDTDTVVIDGQVVDTIYHYQDTVVT